MPDLIKSYYLRLTAEMSRELRHHCIEGNTTMNAVIVAAIRRHLDAARPAAVVPADTDRPGQG